MPGIGNQIRDNTLWRMKLSTHVFDDVWQSIDQNVRTFDSVFYKSPKHFTTYNTTMSKTSRLWLPVFYDKLPVRG